MKSQLWLAGHITHRSSGHGCRLHYPALFGPWLQATLPSTLQAMATNYITPHSSGRWLSGIFLISHLYLLLDTPTHDVMGIHTLRATAADYITQHSSGQWLSGIFLIFHLYLLLDTPTRDVLGTLHHCLAEPLLPVLSSLSKGHPRLCHIPAVKSLNH